MTAYIWIELAIPEIFTAYPSISELCEGLADQMVCTSI